MRLTEPYVAHEPAQVYDRAVIAADCAARVLFDVITLSILTTLLFISLHGEGSSLTSFTAVILFCLHYYVRHSVTHDCLNPGSAKRVPWPSRFIQGLTATWFPRWAAKRAGELAGDPSIVVFGGQGAFFAYGIRLDQGTLVVDTLQRRKDNKPLHEITESDIALLRNSIAERWDRILSGIRPRNVSFVHGDVGRITLEAGRVGATTSYSHLDKEQGVMGDFRVTTFPLDPALGKLTFFDRIRTLGKAVDIDWEVRWEPPLNELTMNLSSLRDPMHRLRSRLRFLFVWLPLVAGSIFTATAITANCRQVLRQAELGDLEGAAAAIQVLSELDIPYEQCPEVQALDQLPLTVLLILLLAGVVAAIWKSLRRYRVRQLVRNGVPYQLGYRVPLAYVWWNSTVPEFAVDEIYTRLRIVLRSYLNSCRDFFDERNIDCQELRDIRIESKHFSIKNSGNLFMGKVDKIVGDITGTRKDYVQPNISTLSPARGGSGDEK